MVLQEGVFLWQENLFPDNKLVCHRFCVVDELFGAVCCREIGKKVKFDLEIREVLATNWIFVNWRKSYQKLSAFIKQHKNIRPNF